MTRTRTIVATVSLGASSLTDDEVARAVELTLSRCGGRLVGCDWSPDPDTISDCVDGGGVEVLDLNPARPSRQQLVRCEHGHDDGGPHALVDSCVHPHFV